MSFTLKLMVTLIRFENNSMYIYLLRLIDKHAISLSLNKTCYCPATASVNRLQIWTLIKAFYPMSVCDVQILVCFPYFQFLYLKYRNKCAFNSLVIVTWAIRKHTSSSYILFCGQCEDKKKTRLQLFGDIISAINMIFYVLVFKNYIQKLI